MRHLSERAPLALFGVVLSVLCVGLLLLLFSVRHSGAPELSWDPVYERALEVARAEHRPLALLITLPKCAACAALERETLTSAPVRRALKRFVLARHELAAQQNSLRLFGTDVAIAGTPTLMFFDADGRLADTPRLEGFVPAKTLVRALAQSSGRLFAPPAATGKHSP